VNAVHAKSGGKQSARAKNHAAKLAFNFKTVSGLLAIVLLLAACGVKSSDAVQVESNSAQTSSGDSGRLAAVRERGQLICGISDALVGFGLVDNSGSYSGFDIDFCRVVAAGVLGDAAAVEFRRVETADRFAALQSGEIDVLIRNTTWTATRDGREGANFLFTTLYDGQGFVVRADSGIRSLEDLDGATICVGSGTTTEQNLFTTFSDRNISFTPQFFGNVTDLQAAYESRQCQSYTGDVSALTTYKFSSEAAGGPEQFVIPEVISKEPLGPVVADGDTEWAQAVNWSITATVQAWEFGLDSSNIQSYAGDDGNILDFLGRNNFNPQLGLSPDFAINVISQVGNYKEIYDRNLEALGLPMEGSLNQLWTDGGLLYTPPYR